MSKLKGVLQSTRQTRVSARLSQMRKSLRQGNVRRSGQSPAFSSAKEAKPQADPSDMTPEYTQARRKSLDLSNRVP
jgi:hypothetical protein